MYDLTQLMSFYRLVRYGILKKSAFDEKRIISIATKLEVQQLMRKVDGEVGRQFAEDLGMTDFSSF